MQFYYFSTAYFKQNQDILDAFDYVSVCMRRECNS
jgi:hypothetical protein